MKTFLTIFEISSKVLSIIYVNPQKPHKRQTGIKSDHFITGLPTTLISLKAILRTTNNALYNSFYIDHLGIMPQL